MPDILGLSLTHLCVHKLLVKIYIVPKITYASSFFFRKLFILETFNDLTIFYYKINKDLYGALMLLMTVQQRNELKQNAKCSKTQNGWPKVINHIFITK